MGGLDIKAYGLLFGIAVYALDINAIIIAYFVLESLTGMSRIQWNGTTPYITIGSRLYGCHQGYDKNVSHKKKFAERRHQRVSLHYSSYEISLYGSKPSSM